jgi:hypothetical protein
MDTIQEMLETALQSIEPTTGRLAITIRGKQHNGDGRPKRDRTITVNLSGKDAQDFQAHPTLDTLWYAYGADLGDGMSNDIKQAILIETITVTSQA